MPIYGKVLFMKSYPYECDLIDISEYSIKVLGDSDLRFPAGGKTKFLNSFLSWKLVQKIELLQGLTKL